MGIIAVVDDAPEVVQWMSKALKSAGHRVIECIGSKDLEMRLGKEKPNLIFLDVVMPERDGYQVLRSLRRYEETSDIPVFLVSSKGEPTDVEWGMNQGAKGYLVKPFSEERLLDAVREALAS